MERERQESEKDDEGDAGMTFAGTPGTKQDASDVTTR